MLRNLIKSFFIMSVVSATVHKFKRTIEATAYPYYKIVLNMGKCTDKIIFKEENTYASVHLNRILDIFYHSNDSDVVVSAVQINLIINNTDFLAVSESGVGSAKFGATIFFGIDTGVTYYILKIFSCMFQVKTDK